MKKILNQKYHIETISAARAAYNIYQVYEDVFDKMKDKIKIDDLTKMEKYMVNDFFKKLKAPMRNPNIEIPEGQVTCYYDKDYRANFYDDLKLSLEYMQKECNSTIGLFSTQD